MSDTTVLDRNDNIVYKFKSSFKYTNELLLQMVFINNPLSIERIPRFSVISENDGLIYHVSIFAHLKNPEDLKKYFSENLVKEAKDFFKSLKKDPKVMENLTKEHDELKKQYTIDFKKFEDVTIEGTYNNIYDIKSIFNSIKLDKELFAVGFGNALKVHQSIKPTYENELKKTFFKGTDVSILTNTLKALIFIDNQKIQVTLKDTNPKSIKITINTFKVVDLEKVRKYVQKIVLSKFNMEFSTTINNVYFNLILNSNLALVRETLQQILTSNESNSKYGLKFNLTKSDDTLSLTYISDKTHSLNIYDFQKDSSIIKLTLLNNLELATYIIHLLVFLYTSEAKLFPIDSTLEGKHNIRTKGFIEAGLKYDTRSCQQPQQPYLLSEDAANEYDSEHKMTIEHNNQEYNFVCTDPKNQGYKFPSLTEEKKNGKNFKYICCYKKSQKSSSNALVLNSKKHQVNRLVFLTDELQNILDPISESKESRVGVFRFGISQIGRSFLNCIGSVYDTPSSQIITEIVDLLNNDKSLYYILDNGALKSRYSFDNYISLLEEKEDLHYTDLIDLSSIHFNVNIIVLERRESNGEFRSFISCNSTLVESNEFIIILYNEDTNIYDRLVKAKYSPKDKRVYSGSVVHYFNKDDEIVQKLMDLKESNCSNVLKSVSNNIKMPNKIQELQKAAKKTEVNVLKISAKIVNNFNEVLFIQVQYKVLIPVNDTYNQIGLLKNISDIEIPENKQLGSFHNTILMYELLGIPIVGYTLDKQNKFITSIKTGYNILTPVKPVEYNKNLEFHKKYTVLLMKYPYGIHNLYEPTKVVTTNEYLNEIMNELAEIINSKDLKNDVLITITNPKLPRYKKVAKLKELLEPYVTEKIKEYLEISCIRITNDTNMEFLTTRIDKLVVRKTEFTLNTLNELNQKLYQFK